LNNKINLERELDYLGLLNKAREIYFELGEKAVLSYLKSSYRLLSKVYHPDLNPEHNKRAKLTQQRLNMLKQMIGEISDDDLLEIIEKGTMGQVPRKKRILVVEDEHGLQDILYNIFLMEGYDVRVAVDGYIGYEVFCQFNPDLLLTDVIMPNMNGTELVNRAREKKSGIKVIYMSGFFGTDKVGKELQTQVIKYKYKTISKPFKLSLMLNMVDNYINDIGASSFTRGI